MLKSILKNEKLKKNENILKWKVKAPPNPEDVI